MGKRLWPALAAVVLLALTPTAAAAAVRHASPGGGTTGTCTDGEPPCSLKYAVETVAASGDEVVLAPGLYEPASQVVINKAIEVHGQAGQARPRVVRPAGGVFSVSGGGTLSDVRLEAPGSVLTVSSLAERVTVLAGPAPAPPKDAVRVTDGGVLRDSLVRTDATDGRAVTGAFGVARILNVTAIATDPGSSALYADATIGGICVPGSMVELHAANVIARGGKYDVDVPGACDESAGEPPIESAHMTHSNFRRSKVNATPPPGRLEDEGGNQDVEPLFTAPASLDFHQLAGSPTIDAGTAAPPLLGTADIDGQPRTQGSAPDIGADEFVPPVVEPPRDMRRPVASLLAVSPSRFRAAPARATGSARRRTGTRISYALDEAATVTFTLKRIVTRFVRKRKRLGYRPLRGSFKDAGEVGGNRLRYRGRLRGRRLKPGLYRLIALPVDAAGNTGNAVYVRFRIVR